MDLFIKLIKNNIIVWNLNFIVHLIICTLNCIIFFCSFIQFLFNLFPFYHSYIWTGFFFSVFLASNPGKPLTSCQRVSPEPALISRQRQQTLGRRQRQDQTAKNRRNFNISPCVITIRSFVNCLLAFCPWNKCVFHIKSIPHNKKSVIVRLSKVNSIYV